MKTSFNVLVLHAVGAFVCTVLLFLFLRTQKASFNTHKPSTEETKSKEVIDTGVDIKSLVSESNENVIPFTVAVPEATLRV